MCAPLSQSQPPNSSSSSGSTTASQDQLIKDIFENEISVVSQFEACSRGQFKLQPPNATQGLLSSPSLQLQTIKKGVVTIQLNESVIGRTTTDVYEDIETKALSQFGDGIQNLQDEFDFVMVCMPYGTLTTVGGSNW